jgi:superfamily I DNA and/or RNA helicase
VDEAGQMSLANVLAASPAADSLVLLGDPQQLEQPQKGSHPDGVDVSALQHFIGDAQTMPVDRGLFMPVTWRLAPAVCRFTSEVFYEGKLEPRPELAQQRLEGVAPFDGAGLWVVPVSHTGNQNASVEEVDEVERIVSMLLVPGARWVTSTGEALPLTAADLRVVSPYNAQVNRLAARFEARGVPVGTVDRFQGQEAPVVIYSMATSHPDDAPRGMEFLYSLNRLNVATSRARCVSIVVASPRLFEPECRTPRQMLLANALARYREMAHVIKWPRPVRQ